MPTSDDWSLGEIVRSLQRIEESQEKLTSKVDGLAAGFLPRSEWDVWAKARDREIAELKSARAPWWSWATVGIALVMLVVTIANLI